jgi:hypothetical protein
LFATLGLRLPSDNDNPMSMWSYGFPEVASSMMVELWSRPPSNVSINNTVGESQQANDDGFYVKVLYSRNHLTEKFLTILFLLFIYVNFAFILLN